MTVVDTRTGEIVDTLTVEERDALAAHESVIDRNLRAFVEAGEALGAIRDSRLYRSTHGTFEAYCQDRWALSRKRSYDLIDAARTVASLSPMGDTPAPVMNERQARVLAPVIRDHGPAVARQILDRVAETAGKVTAAALTEAIKADPVVTQADHDRWNGLYAEHKASGVYDALMAERPYADAITDLHMAATDVNNLAMDPAVLARHVPAAFAHCVPDILAAAARLAAFTSALPEEH